LLFAHRFINTQLVDAVPYTALGEPGNKFTMALLRKGVKTFSLRESNEELSVQLLNEDSATLHFCLMFPRSKPLTQIFIYKIDQLISSGIVRRLEEQQSTRVQSIFEYGQLQVQRTKVLQPAVGIMSGRDETENSSPKSVI
jgi:hypothetical protein